MSAFNRLTDAFNDPGNQNHNRTHNTSDNSPQSPEIPPSSPNNTPDMIKRSKAIIRAVDKLKSQGIQITKKAELDYILAARYLERHHIDLDLQNEFQPQIDSENDEPHDSDITPIKRTPQHNPKEFEIALAHSRKFTAETEELLKRGKTLPQKQLDEYQLCKTFLKKFT